MANFKIKKLPPIRLVDLLKKRKTTLKQFLNVYGIVAYPTLLIKCDSMGVSPPTEEEFRQVVGPIVVSSPQEGIVVLDSPPLLKENTGQPVLVDDMGNVHVLPISEIPSQPLDKASKKKEKIKIDESIFITPEKSFMISGSNSPHLGEATSVEDDIDSSVMKLSHLKKQNSGDAN